MTRKQTSPINRTFRFGEFQVSPDAGLFRSGQRIAVPPKELGLLEILLNKHGNVATHAEIEAALWPNVDVSYASLARCVHSLRKSLGDQQRSIIVTLPKRGYAMGVPVFSSVSGRILSVSEKTVHAETRAYSYFLEGIREANRGGPDSQRRAIDLFGAACQIDASYAVPLAAIADCRMYQAIRGYEMPMDVLQAGLDACTRALSIDDSLASAHAARGWFTGVMQRNPDAGLRSIDTALVIDPEYARAHAYRAWVLRGVGQLAESLVSARRAVELDPHSLLNRHLLAWTLFCAGDVDEALALERAERLERPYVDMGHAYVAIMDASCGRHEDALVAADEAARVSQENPTVMTALTYACASAGDTSRARRIAEELASRILPRAIRPHLAMTFVALHDFDRALSFLAEAKAEYCPWFLGARFDPRLRALANETRLRRLYD